MTLLDKRDDDLTVALRWSARLLGLVATILFAELVINWGPGVILALPWGRPTGMPLFVALVLAVAGVMVAWRWETIGGALALAGSLAILLSVYLSSGTVKLPVAFLLAMPLLLAGVLYLACSGCAAASSRFGRSASR